MGKSKKYIVSELRQKEVIIMVLVAFVGAILWTGLMVLIEEVKPAPQIVTQL